MQVSYELQIFTEEYSGNLPEDKDRICEKGLERLISEY